MAAHNPADRSLIASIASEVSWSRTPDRTARTEAARKAFADRFETQVPPEVTDPATRALAAENLRRAFYKGLALKSAQARRAKAAERRGPRNRAGDQ